MAEKPATPDLVGLTRLALDAANQRDIDAVVSFFARDAFLAGRALGDVFEGRAAIRGFLNEWFGSFAEVSFDAEQFVVVDEDVVLVVVNQEGRPVGVDGRVHQREGWTIRRSADGLIERLTVHADLNEARAAAERLAEEPE